jgi:hypothetical protein
LAIHGVHSAGEVGQASACGGLQPDFLGLRLQAVFGAEASRKSSRIENGGLKGRLQARLPATRSVRAASAS